MKNKVLRIIMGIPIGITIGYLITIFISIGLGKGDYYPCTPELIEVMGSEIKAVILQTFLCGLLGLGFSASSIIWDIEHWSIVKQTGIYFLIVSVIMMPIAYFTHWMEHSLLGFLSYFGIFVIIFAIIWIVMFFIGKYNVKILNNNLGKMKK